MEEAISIYVEVQREIERDYSVRASCVAFLNLLLYSMPHTDPSKYLLQLHRDVCAPVCSADDESPLLEQRDPCSPHPARPRDPRAPRAARRAPAASRPCWRSATLARRAPRAARRAHSSPRPGDESPLWSTTLVSRAPRDAAPRAIGPVPRATQRPAPRARGDQDILLDSSGRARRAAAAASAPGSGTR